MTQETITQVEETVSAPVDNGTPTTTLRDQYIAEERSRLEPMETPESEQPEGAEPIAEGAEAATEPAIELEPLDENLERYPKAKPLFEQAQKDPEAWSELKDYLTDHDASIHNTYSDFNDQLSARADAVVAQVDAAQATVATLATAVQRGIANGTINAQELANLLNDDAKAALKALAPHVIAAERDKALNEERGQIQVESFNQGVVFALYEPVKGLKLPNLTKQVTDLLRETKGDEKQQVPSRIISAVHEAGIKVGIRRGEAAFGREKSIANNGGSGPAALAGGVAPGKTDRERLLDPNTPLDELRAIRERQRRAS